MRNFGDPPISPQVYYNSPPDPNQQPTREERITELAYRLEDLAGELLNFVTSTSPTTTAAQSYPISHPYQSSQATTQEEHQAEVAQSRAIRQLAVATSAVIQSHSPSRNKELSTSLNQQLNSRTATECFSNSNITSSRRVAQQQSASTSTPVVQQQSTSARAPSSPDPKRVIRVTPRTSTVAQQQSASTSDKVQHLSTPPISCSNQCLPSHSKQFQSCHRTPRTSNTSYKKKKSKSPTFHNNNNHNSPLTTNFQEGDKVQITGGNPTFRGLSGCVVRVTNKQVCVRVNQNIVYRKKNNLRKLNF